MKYLWGFGALILLLIWLFFPSIFNWWAEFAWNVPEADLKKVADLGPLGDIYGSLNTLFTSVTLIIVVYSVYLQRQANQDARDAMVKQLQQARDDTDKQLEQAHQATEQQILNAQKLADIQLEQAKETSKKQLELAEASLNAQMKESQYAIFTNMFHTLMSQKIVFQNSLCDNLNHYKTPQQLFIKMSDEFANLLSQEWQDVSNLETVELSDKFTEIANKLSESETFSDILYSYFFIYDSIFYLLKNSKIDKEQKKVFYKFIGNSMDFHEQSTFLWFTAFTNQIRKNLLNTRTLDYNFGDEYIPFILKFHKKSHFVASNIHQAFKKLEQEETPA